MKTIIKSTGLTINDFYNVIVLFKDNSFIEFLHCTLESVARIDRKYSFDENVRRIHAELYYE